MSYEIFRNTSLEVPNSAAGVNTLAPPAKSPQGDCRPVVRGE